jgi:hypothetical protein
MKGSDSLFEKVGRVWTSFQQQLSYIRLAAVGLFLILLTDLYCHYLMVMCKKAELKEFEESEYHKRFREAREEAFRAGLLSEYKVPEVKDVGDNRMFVMVSVAGLILSAINVIVVATKCRKLWVGKGSIKAVDFAIYALSFAVTYKLFREPSLRKLGLVYRTVKPTLIMMGVREQIGKQLKSVPGLYRNEWHFITNVKACFGVHSERAAQTSAEAASMYTENLQDVAINSFKNTLRITMFKGLIAIIFEITCIFASFMCLSDEDREQVSSFVWSKPVLLGEDEAKKGKTKLGRGALKTRAFSSSGRTYKRATHNFKLYDDWDYELYDPESGKVFRMSGEDLDDFFTHSSVGRNLASRFYSGEIDYDVLSLNESFVKDESFMADSGGYKTPRPDGVIILKGEDGSFGRGFVAQAKIGGKEKRIIVSAKHVFSSIGKTCTPIKDFDLGYVEVAGEWAKLTEGVRSLKLALPEVGKTVLMSVTRNGEDWVVGGAITDVNGFDVYHRCSTLEGDSGSPLMFGDKVVAIHLQGARGVTNIALSSKALLDNLNFQGPSGPQSVKPEPQVTGGSLGGQELLTRPKATTGQSLTTSVSTPASLKRPEPNTA